jgi:hypothetical protein
MGQRAVQVDLANATDCQVVLGEASAERMLRKGDLPCDLGGLLRERKATTCGGSDRTRCKWVSQIE